MTGLKLVETLYETNAADVAAMLRQTADSVESETDDNDRTKFIVAVQVTQEGVVAVYGWGAVERFSAIGALQAGVGKLIDGVEEHEV